MEVKDINATVFSRWVISLMEDNMLSWNERILYAAYLRALLFCRVMELQDKDG